MNMDLKLLRPPNTDGIIHKLVTVFARPTVRSYGRAFAPAPKANP